MIKLPILLSELMKWAKDHHLSFSERHDLGYVLHAALKASFPENTPSPFVLEGNDVLAYSSQDLSHSQAVCPIFEASRIESKTMPETWQAGAFFRFQVRICPVIREKNTEHDIFHKKKREGDHREPIYAFWLKQQFEKENAVSILETQMISYQGICLERRDQSRAFKSIPRPEAVFQGVLQIRDPQAFQTLLSRGIGRHRAFGFGMILLKAYG
jgi:CRISPR system Cascade subunit CasE